MMKEIFHGVFRKGNDLFTINLVPGKRVYGERLVNEYREWIPQRSKLAAAILNGLKDFPFTEGSKVLYLGASTGTTPSHVSDIAGESGIIYAVEFSESVFHKLIDLAKQRKNIVPVMADARKPEEYGWVEECDVVYADIADPQQTQIAIRNTEFLKQGGYLLVAVKSQSIDITKQPKQVYKEESEKLRIAGFSVLQVINLEPFEEKHCMIVARR